MASHNTQNARPRNLLVYITALLAVIVIACLPGLSQSGIENVDEPLRNPAAKNPDAVAVVVGIKSYRDKDMPAVDFASDDVAAVHKVLSQTLGFNESRIVLLTDSQASLTDIRSLIKQRLKTMIVPGKSDIFFYFSGHGAPNPDTHDGYLLPWEYNPAYVPVDYSAYSMKELFVDLSALQAKSVVVLIDACFSGLSDAQKNGHAAAVLKDASPAYVEVNLSAAEANEVIITATKPDQIATWDRTHHHGVLTYSWLKAMHGDEKAEDANGTITVASLKKYLDTDVPELARLARNRAQNPQVRARDEGLVLAKLPVSALHQGTATLVQKYGSLAVTIDLGGELFLDDVPQGTIPPGQVFSVKQITAGPHQVEIRKEGHAPIQEQVVVPPDSTASKYYQLFEPVPRSEKAYGLIQVSGSAGGTLYIDDRKVADLSPFEKYTTARVDAGQHQVRIEKQGYATAAEAVLVHPDETAKQDFTQQPAIKKAPEIASVRFFPYENNALTPEGSRVYQTHFKAGEIAGIGWEVGLTDKLPGNGLEVHWYFGDSEIVGCSSRVMGSSQGCAKNWGAGSYRVDFLVDGKKIGRGVFYVDPAAANQTSAETLPPRDQGVNLTGIWHDSAGVTYQVSQRGNTFTYSASSPVSASRGSGTIRGLEFVSSYEAIVSGVRSTGRCAGTISPDGGILRANCYDSVAGQTSNIVSR